MWLRPVSILRMVVSRQNLGGLIDPDDAQARS